jgi:methylated-DNA-[protein]-cysteine S-methyltransferase
MSVTGLCVFDTAIGRCGIAWSGDAIASSQLPEHDDEGTMRRLLRRHPEWHEAEPPAWVKRVIERVQALLEGAPKMLKEGLGKAEAEDIKKKLTDAGATVTLK